MVGVSSSGEASGARNVQSAPPPSETGHRVRAGETLSAIAERYGTDVASLARANGIADPDRISAGQVLSLPRSEGFSYRIERGDTLGGIARDHGIGLKALLDANPQIANPDRIYPGETLTIPGDVSNRSQDVATPVDGPVRVEGPTRVTNGTLSLTEADVLNIKKTLQTEWVQSAGDAQAHGIVDTILNRTASGHWGDSVADVVNARNQFSDINGPISRRDGRNSVDDIPASQISGRVDRLVDDYLAARAGGQASSIGSHLNYANPNFSSPNNLGWINALDGPVLGRGNAVHHHGTVPELQRHRPADFAVALPGGEAAAPAQGPVDGNALAASSGVGVKSDKVAIDQLDPAMAPAIRAAADAAQRLGLPSPVITSGNDSTHSSRSLHYENKALDFRGNNMSIEQGRAFQTEMRRLLGPQYDVVFETFANRSNNHLHVEYDPK